MYRHTLTHRCCTDIRSHIVQRLICCALLIRVDYSGCAVLLERGCGKFIDVAKRYAEMHACAVIFVNSDDAVISMGSGADELNVPIPVVMVGRGVLDLRAGDRGWKVHIKPQLSQLPLSSPKRSAVTSSPLRLRQSPGRVSQGMNHSSAQPSSRRALAFEAAPSYGNVGQAAIDIILRDEELLLQQSLQVLTQGEPRHIAENTPKTSECTQRNENLQAQGIQRDLAFGVPPKFVDLRQDSEDPAYKTVAMFSQQSQRTLAFGIPPDCGELNQAAGSQREHDMFRPECGVFAHVNLDARTASMIAADIVCESEALRVAAAGQILAQEDAAHSSFEMQNAASKLNERMMSVHHHTDLRVETSPGPFGDSVGAADCGLSEDSTWCWNDNIPHWFDHGALSNLEVRCVPGVSPIFVLKRKFL